MTALVLLLVILVAAVVAAAFMLNALYNAARVRIPYVPTPDWAIKWLVENLAPPTGALVYDLGCGDGRVLCALAMKHPSVRFIGLELQWWPYVVAKGRSRKMPNLQIQRINFWSRNISDAHYVFCYLFQPVLEKMKMKLESELRPGATVVSFGFHIPDWTPTKEISDPTGQTKSRILIYRRQSAILAIHAKNEPMPQWPGFTFFWFRSARPAAQPGRPRSTRNYLPRSGQRPVFG